MHDGTFTIQLTSTIEIVDVQCDWRWRPTSKDGLPHCLYLVSQVLGVTGIKEQGLTTSKDRQVYLSLAGGSKTCLVDADSAVARFLVDFVTREAENGNKAPDRTAAIFLVPSVGGFVAHATFLAQRLASCALVLSATTFLEPRGEVTPFSGNMEGTAEIVQALNVCIGALRVDRSSLQGGTWDTLEWELKRRLSCNWLLPEQLHQRRVVVVTNSENLDEDRSRWETAASLGVLCVIVSPSIWWQDHSPYSHLREACISIDFTLDEHFWERIVKVVHEYPLPIDGIFTPADRYLRSVAKAAQGLGLYTLDPTALELCTDKCQTARLLDPASKEHFILSSPEELDLVVESGRPIPFPAVCKPAIGRSSEGVFISHDLDQLREAVAKTLTSSRGFEDVLVEPYVGGPEVDVNIVILDGDILYAEVVDDFPKPGDSPESSAGNFFTETLTMIPSKLSAEEQEAIIDAMLKVVLKQGFSTGVFHCEGRVRNSQMAYEFATGSSIPDLQPSENQKLNEKIEVFLHEVNPRLPGSVSVFRSFLGQGVDFWCLSILFALQDIPRLKGLSMPFLQRHEGDHVLNMTINAWVTPQLVHKMFPSEPEERLHRHFIPAFYDPMPALRQRHPEFVGHVIRHFPIIIFSDRYGLGYHSIMWDATLVIRSSHSREDAISRAAVFEGLYKAYLKERYESDVEL